MDTLVTHQTRDHTDIEIAIFREDQLALQRILKGWRLELSTKEGRRIWQPGEWLQLPLHEIHTYDSDNDGVEFLLNEKSDSEWVFRRNKAVKREISALTMYTQDGIPFFGPEIVLLYKAGQGRDALSPFSEGRWNRVAEPVPTAGGISGSAKGSTSNSLSTEGASRRWPGKSNPRISSSSRTGYPIQNGLSRCGKRPVLKATAVRHRG